MKKHLVILILISALLSSCMKLGMGRLDRNDQKEIINELTTLLMSSYIFEDVAMEMSGQLKKQFKNGAYDSLTDPQDFAKALEKEMVKISHDSHLWFIFSPGYVQTIKKRIKDEEKGGAGVTPKDLRRYKEMNYGFAETKILEGNIGYMRISSFVDTAFGAAKTVALQNLKKLKGTQSIIIDLRANRGGYASMSDLIYSCFFPEPILLNTIICRKDKSQVKNYSYRVEGLNFKQDLYILIDAESYSAAEGFAYTMQKHGRALLIGEKTAGGAHSSDRLVVWDYFAIQLPVIYTEHPITKSDWEGTGVIPDIKAGKEKAMDIALKLISENE